MTVTYAYPLTVRLLTENKRGKTMLAPIVGIIFSSVFRLLSCLCSSRHIRYLRITDHVFNVLNYTIIKFRFFTFFRNSRT